MIRRGSTPWIYRWSRPLMAGIASIGAVGTGYLTVVKLTEGTAACPTGGCDVVLSSPYATVFGLPLTLFGFLGYLSMIVFAIAPLLLTSPNQKKLRANIEQWTGLLLFLGGTAMVVFSSYLMYLLAFVIKAPCMYCIVSAVFSACLFILSIIGRYWEDIGKLLFSGVIVALIVIVGTLGVYANVNNPRVEAEPTNGYAISTTSSAAELGLAEHLKQIGAKMYGAFTCPHCQNQKQLFGKEAAAQLNYIECHPQGENSQPDLCMKAGIQAFPTWEIERKSYQGEKTLAELADLSGYQGDRNFANASEHDH